MWIDVNGGRLFLQHEGEGAPLLLVHGWTLDRRMFEPQISRLSKFFHAISYDRRGFGRSQAPPDLQLELDDLDRIADALSLGTIHLLGMSQGARLALRYAVTRPQRLRSLLLQGAVVDGLPTGGYENEQVPLAEYAELVRNGRLDEMHRRWLAHPLMSMQPGHESVQRLVNEILADYTGADLLDFSPDSYAFSQDVPGKLALLHAPTLILTGATETRRLRAQARKLLEIIPDCREVVFEHSGHLSNLTEPDSYNEEVIRFCGTVDGTQPSPG